MLRTILGITGAQEYNRVTPALFAYWFHRIDMEEFIDYVGERREGTRIKDVARVNGYILKHCKLYAYACHVARMRGDVIPRSRDYGVTAKDAVLLRKLNLNHLDTKLYRPFSLEEFDDTVNTLIGSAEIKNNIGKFVSKKMAFLMRSYGMKRHDIEAHLKEMAIIAVYKQFPRYESYLHMVNVAKAQIHNAGQSFITSSTAKSKAQHIVYNDAGIAEATHLPMQLVADVEAPPVAGMELRERLQALASVEHKLSDRTKQFLMCAAGQYHEGFSGFLRCRNDEAVEAMDYERYMSKIQAYFNVSPERTIECFNFIRDHIYGGSNDRRIIKAAPGDIRSKLQPNLRSL